MLPESLIGDVFKASFQSAVTRLTSIDAKLRESDDPEALHDARLAVRRLRSFLRTFRPILDSAWAGSLRERLAWLNGCFGEARDLDVLLGMVETHRSELLCVGSTGACNAIARLRAEHHRKRAALKAALNDARYLPLMDDLFAAARRPRFNERAGQPARRGMRRLLRGAWKRAAKRVRAFKSPSDAQLHEIRIKTKHVRYAAECLALVSPKSGQRLARRAERLQTALGERHDAVMAAERLGTPPEVFGPPAGKRWRRLWRKTRAAYRRAG